LSRKGFTSEVPERGPNAYSLKIWCAKIGGNKGGNNLQTGRRGKKVSTEEIPGETKEKIILTEEGRDHGVQKVLY